MDTSPENPRPSTDEPPRTADGQRLGRDIGRFGRRIGPLVVGVFVLVGVAWIARYQPVVSGNATETPGEPAEELLQGRPEVVIPYVHGDAYSYGFTIQNTGPLPTTILEVVVPQAGLLHPEEIRLSPPDDPLALDPDDAVPFRPFELDADEERGILITARFLRCDRHEGGGGIRKVGEELSVRTFVLSRTASVRFPTTIRVRSPGEGSGPRPGCPVVGPDVATATERPSDGLLDLDASLLATPEGEFWLTSLDKGTWSGCRGAIEAGDDRYEADVGRIAPLETLRVPATDFRLDGRPFRSRRVRADRVEVTCAVSGEEASGGVPLSPYEPRALDALPLPEFGYSQDR